MPFTAVHVFLPHSLPDSAVEKALAAEDHRRAAGFRFEKDRLHWRQCRAALRILLGEALGRPPAELVLEIDPQGKPHLPAADRLDFNLSHCADLALIAIGDSGPLGVDIEPAGRATELLGCEETFCHPREIARLPAAPQARARALLDLWTAKEAFLKAAGTGLLQAPQEIEIATDRLSATGTPLLAGLTGHPLHHPSLREHVALLAAPSLAPAPVVLPFRRPVC